MSEPISIIVFIGLWLALQFWVLPKLGVPT